MRRTLERLRAGADKEMKGLASMLDGVNGVMDGYQREMRETLRGPLYNVGRVYRRTLAAE